MRESGAADPWREDEGVCGSGNEEAADTGTDGDEDASVQTETEILRLTDRERA